MQPEIRKLTLSTLSPVHIGCGEDFEPGNFVIHDGLLHTLDVETLAAALKEDERKQLANLASEPNPIGKVQAFFGNRSERLSTVSAHQIPVVAGIAREYAQKMGRATQQGNAGADHVFNQFIIERTVWQPYSHAAYLPGSSLKGSIRTAWLNRLNRGQALHTPRESNAELQYRLLAYTSRNLHQDPFRLLALADALSEEDAPPTRILYAISKKKRPSERTPSEIKVYREAISEALPAAFVGEMRFLPRKAASAQDITWEALCEACNHFYGKQLSEELRDNFLGAKLEKGWRQLMIDLLNQELDSLIRARQGFLLRVGRHSGAESVTLEGVRNIKSIGPKVEGKATSTYRSLTTEKRFATNDPATEGALFPFGWIWVDACDDAHRHLHDSFRRKLAAYSEKMRENHRDRLLANENRRAERQHQAAERAAQKQAALAAEAQRERDAAEKLRQLAAMTPARRAIAEFSESFRQRAEALRGNKERLNADYHSKATAFAQQALEATDWTAEEKAAAAEAIAEYLPQVVEKIDKEQLKKLKLAALRGH